MTQHPWFRLVMSSLLVIALAAQGSLQGEEPGDKEATRPPAREEADYYELLKLFVETFQEVDRNYVTPLSRRELVEAAIDGMLSKLDQNSDYISPQELEQFRRGVESEFDGIGVQVAIENEELTIVSPIVDSPAYRAGLVAGDVITHIGGEPTQGLPLAEAMKRMKGKLGTRVELTVRHAEDKSVRIVTIEREHVRLRTVLGDRRKADDSWDFMYDDEHKIGYVRITTFARHTVDELRAALDELHAAELRGLLLDLRSNPGGLLSSAVEVSDLFVADGVIVSASGRSVANREWSAHRAGTVSDFPMAVLVNRFSASASEIVAACLQDHERAAIVGQRTWGKGSVQNIVRLEGGRSALKLTTSEYRRPKGGSIHRREDATEADEWGVKPDAGLELKLTDAESAQLDRLRRNRDLLGHRASEHEEFVDQQFQLGLNYLIEQLASRRPGPVVTEVAAQAEPSPAAGGP